MIPQPILSIISQLDVNDWFLAVMIVTFLLMLIVMGPYRASYYESFSSMFRFKSPDSDVSFPLHSTMEYIMVFILSCISIGVSVAVYSHDVMEKGLSLVLFILWYSSLVIGLFLLKLTLYSIVNRILYRRQVIMLKPGRWNCFFVMSFSVAGLLILAFSIIVMFFNLPLVMLLVFAYLMRILVVTGRIFKIKSALFRNKSSKLGFIVYLCAFEIAPILVEFIITSKIFGLI